MIDTPKSLIVWHVKGTYKKWKYEGHSSGLVDVEVLCMCLATTAASAATMFMSYYKDGCTIEFVSREIQPDSILQEGEQ